MRFKEKYWYGIGIGIIVLIIDIVLFRTTRFFTPLIAVALTIGWSQIWIDYFIENSKKKEYEARFLDFVRNLVGAIKSGMPVPKAIIHVANESDYGSLTPRIKKLAHQIEWAMPVHKALKNFAKNTENDIIIRAVSTVIEAEQAGGNMEDVLESITVSLLEIKKIKEQRRASIHSQMIQSYIIFFIFLGIMVVIQSFLIPYLGKMAGTNLAKGTVGETGMIGVQNDVHIDFSSTTSFIISIKDWFVSLKGIFLMLSMIQGFFAGIIIGKLSEGDLISGLKHSIILMTLAFIIMTSIA